MEFPHSNLADIFDLSVTSHIDVLSKISDAIIENDIKPIIKRCVEKVILHDDTIEIVMLGNPLADYYIGKYGGVMLPPIDEKRTRTITDIFKTQRTTKGAIITSNSNNPLDLPPDTIKQWVQGIVWRDEHFDGKSMKQIAQERNVSPAYIAKCINISLEQ